MACTVAILPNGHLNVRERPADDSAAASSPAVSRRIVAAFATSPAAGLLHLATAELRSINPQDLAYLRDFGRTYLTRLCLTHNLNVQSIELPIPPPTDAELATLVLQAPPVDGLEYLNSESLTT